MDLRELYEEESQSTDTRSSYDYNLDDLSYKKYGKPKKIKFMRGYNDDGEMIFDPFDPKEKPDDQKKINYNKRFSKEMKQHHKLIRQQAVYVDQLEKLFRATTGLGSANPRQLTKTDVELASVLSQARGQLLQMINGVGTLKKTIADLQMKQFKELYAGAANDQVGTSEDLRGSAVLQQLINTPAASISTPVDMTNLPDMSELDSDESLVGVDVKNEGKNIQLAIVHNSETSTNTPVALNDAGEVVDDYNIPSYMNDVDLYFTEGIAKDKLGHTFPLIVR